MPLFAAESAIRYREKNKDVVRNRDNLYREVERLGMKVMNPIKNAERLKNRVAKAAYRKRKREEIEASISQSPSKSTAAS